MNFEVVEADFIILVTDLTQEPTIDPIFHELDIHMRGDLALILVVV